MWHVLRTAALCVAACAGVALWFGAGKPAMVQGMFIVSGLAVGSLYALGGIGLVVLYRATGVLNLSAGAIGMASVMAAWQLVQWGLFGPVAWVGGLAIGVALALFYGRVIAPQMAWREPVVKAVASLGYAIAILGVVSFLFPDEPRKFSLPTDSMAVMILGLRVTVTRLLVVLAAIVLVVGITISLNTTRVGLQMRALANNRSLSSLIGIPILRVETLAWGLSGLLFGFTGLMFGDLVRLEPSVITFMVIPCIAAAICGRLQSLPDVLMGGLAIGVIESLLTFSDTFKQVRPIAPFVIAALVLLAMNRGRRLTFAGDD
ncbi:branched-chain amino acid ABC transporter permease [Celeribacter litoreus]|uniref:branched-chain amino acid ABC transporter permease n=1 Tax=Celeribacter litoreus TaxID=2876714 RepID=UPI001CCF5EA8|nr:branched-chain amino acid ABC transporter permease [Celeribacter litoreus]MCA0044838.1 branched-chain amino acid ABC transporter permease [Celeribacter litoreus]